MLAGTMISSQRLMGIIAPDFFLRKTGLLTFYSVMIKVFQTLETCYGRLAQLVERLPYKEDVGSSSLSTPTIFLQKVK